jgi:hypothetical protein
VRINLFSVRPKRFNIGDEAIFVGVRHLLHEAFGARLNIIQVAATGSGEEAALSGLVSRTIHEMNLYGHGVIVGGGNLYENGGLEIDRHAFQALQPPLMLFSLSYGRIYDHARRLVRRTDAMPDDVISELNDLAVLSVARDDATVEHLRSLNLAAPVLGGCPTLLLSQIELPTLGPALESPPGAVLSIRHPQLMSIPLRDQARLHSTVLGLIEALEADGFGPVRILCHDTRDLTFASSLVDAEFVLPVDVYSYLDLLRRAPLVVSFRLHAFVPCLSFGTPAINISYDERSRSLVRTIGLEAWDIDFVREPNVVAAVRDRCARLDDLAALRAAAQPTWRRLETVMRGAMAEFAQYVARYAAEQPAGGDAGG